MSCLRKRACSGENANAESHPFRSPEEVPWVAALQELRTCPDGGEPYWCPSCGIGFATHLAEQAIKRLLDGEDLMG